MNETEERIALRMTGGPHAGTYSCPVSLYGWPLPDKFEAPGGAYVKVTESKLPTEAVTANVIRGVQFEWREGSDGDAEDRSGENERGAEGG